MEVYYKYNSYSLYHYWINYNINKLLDEKRKKESEYHECSNWEPSFKDHVKNEHKKSISYIDYKIELERNKLKNPPIFERMNIELLNNCSDPSKIDYIKEHFNELNEVEYWVQLYKNPAAIDLIRENQEKLTNKYWIDFYGIKKTYEVISGEKFIGEINKNTLYLSYIPFASHLFKSLCKNPNATEFIKKVLENDEKRILIGEGCHYGNEIKGLHFVGANHWRLIQTNHYHLYRKYETVADEVIDFDDRMSAAGY
jgi:hypothetical protein